MVSEIVTEQEGDSAEFVEIVRSLATGLVREQRPRRLYAIRIDNWFGPKWLSFAGKFSVGSLIGRRHGIGVHRARLHVPPFVPARVVSERVLDGSDFSGVVAAQPVHIDCTSKVALTRRIEDIDKDAVFIWFSSQSQTQQRGSVMIYSTAAFAISSQNLGFYLGFAHQDKRWRPSVLRGISRSEFEQLAKHGRAQLTVP